jgi:predicted RNA-binding protein Jag
MEMELDHKLISNDFENGLVDFATNGHANDSSSSSAGDETATTTSTATVPDPNNYDTIFPSLTPSGVNMAVSDAWNNHDNSKLTIHKHQHTTQIFHVPVEERRYRDVSNANQGFGSNSNETKKKCEDIATRFGVKVEMCCSKDLDLHIVISGLEEKVVEAKKAIIAELQTERDRKMKVPKEQHKFLIGKGGSVLKQIQDQTCTTIQIPKSDTGSDIITITGPKDGIDMAINEIQFICDEQSKTGFERLQIPKLYHPWIRGCSNEVMNDISQRTGAKINIPPPQIEKDEIAVSGEKERVEAACAEIQQIYANKLKLNITKIAIQVTKSQHKLVIGRNGSTVQDIFRDYDVYVQVPKLGEDSETIYLYGEESKLGAAMLHVCAKANSVMNAEIEAPSWLHRYMIGEKG